MNTIERAMGQIVGDSDHKKDDSPTTPDSAATAPAAPKEPAAATAPTEPSPDVAATPAAATPAVPATPPVAPPTQQREAPPGEEVRHGGDSPQTVRDRPVAYLDFEKLGRQGFLVPGMDADHRSDEYQRIKRRLLGNMVPGMMQGPLPPNLVMVTSSVPSEGKTFTSLNLALSMAMEIDRTVLLVDTDIIKADLTRMFGVQRQPGLFNLLSQRDLEVQDVLLHTNVQKLVLLPCGTAGQAATEKLASEAMRRLTEELAQRYPDRIIIFDCPPVLAATGAVALAEHVGQVIMVVEAGLTTHETLRHALDALDQVKVTGLVFNKSKQPQGAGYYYGYYHKGGQAAQNGATVNDEG